MAKQVLGKKNTARKPDAKKKLVLVSGLAGAGHSTALHFLEDAGYTAIDNLPLSLLDQMIGREIEIAGRTLAVSIDARTPGFNPDTLILLLSDVQKRLGDDVTLIFLVASKAELLRRYNATRRRHPLEVGNDLKAAIDQDSARMSGIEGIANVSIDTTGSLPTDFRHRLLCSVGASEDSSLPIIIQSFSYRHGIPDDADMVLDTRFLANPFWIAGLAEKTGTDKKVREFIQRDALFDDTISQIIKTLTSVLPRYRDEGRTQYTIAFGCTGGRHRSVFVAEHIAGYLKAQNHDVRLSHRDLMKSRPL